MILLQTKSSQEHYSFRTLPRVSLVLFIPEDFHSKSTMDPASIRLDVSCALTCDPCEDVVGGGIDRECRGADWSDDSPGYYSVAHASSLARCQEAGPETNQWPSR